MALQPWLTGIITRIEDETHNTKRFWIEVPDLPAFDFAPGQFVTLDLPIHEKPNKRWRSYSIASWPNGTNTFELVIVLLEGGLGSTYLFQNAIPGFRLTLRGPQGVFTLPDPIDKDLYFICTGTGIAPFRSMVHHIKQHKQSHKAIYLIFGTRSRADLLYYHELLALENDLPHFYFLPTLSRESWDGHGGYVHGVYEKLIAEATVNGTRPEAQFYLCGWKAMVDEARDRLLAFGYDKKAVRLELYG